MSKKSCTKPKNDSCIRPVNLEYSHPLEDLQLYIGPLGPYVAIQAYKLRKFTSNQDRLQELQKEGKSAVRRIEMAEMSANGISRWFRTGMQDAAVPQWTQVHAGTLPG